MPDQITVDKELLDAVKKNATFDEIEETVRASQVPSSRAKIKKRRKVKK